MIYECHYDKHYHHSRFPIQKAPINLKEKKLDGREKQIKRSEGMSERQQYTKVIEYNNRRR